MDRPNRNEPQPMLAGAGVDAALAQARAQGALGTAADALERLARVDPELRAFVVETERESRVLAEARALDTTPARAPLFGLAVGVKDVFALDGLPRRAGSSLPPEALRDGEAAIVRRLRERGAFVLGQTVTAEFALLDPGPTGNPWNLEHTPGGSSSGSAAAVAAGLCPLALGTQTVGSVIRPASYCGIVGFKPSFGRLPREGLLLSCPSIDTVGLFTQDVGGMIVACEAVLDGWSRERCAEATRLPRLGIPDGPFLELADVEARGGFEQALDALALDPVPMTPVPCFADLDGIVERHMDLVAHEFARQHAERFERYAQHYRTISARTVRRGQEIGEERAEEGRMSGRRLREELQELARARRVDLWASPAATSLAPAGLEATGSPVMNLPWMHAGLPTLSLPLWRGPGEMPLGLQLAADFGRDEELLGWARALSGLRAFRFLSDTDSGTGSNPGA